MKKKLSIKPKNGIFFLVNPINCNYIFDKKIEVLHEKIISSKDDVFKLYNDISKTTNLYLIDIVKYIYLYESIHYEFNLIISMLILELQLKYETMCHSPKNTMEIGRIIKGLDIIQEKTTTNKKYIEHSLEILLDNPDQQMPIHTIAANRFINELIILLVKYYGYLEWIEHILSNKHTLSAILANCALSNHIDTLYM